MKPEHEDYLVTEALESYPIARLPEGFVANTMSQIKPRVFWQVWIEKLNRVAFLPTALWMFSAGFIAMVSGLVWWAYSRVNPVELHLLFRRINYWLLRTQSKPIYEDLTPLIIMGAAVVVFLVVMITTWVWTDPRRRYPAYF